MDAANRNTALASAFVEELARCGVRHAVVSPGSRSTPLALALWRAPAIGVTVVVDERSGGFAALGMAQASRMPVAVLCTSGTAASNLHPAVSEANESAVPLVVLTADRPPELRGIGAGQTIDQLKLYGSEVRWFCEVGAQDADDAGLIHLRSVACRAFAAAWGEPRPGPVHLNLPWREPLGDTPAEGEVTAGSAPALRGRGERPLTAVAGGAPAPDAGLLDELAERLAAAPRGLIVAGRQLDPALGEAAAALAGASGYPILAEPTSQVRFGPHDRAMVVSAYEPNAIARPRELEPELVVRVGEMPTCKPLRGWLGELEELRQVVIDPSYAWNEPTRRAETIVRGDGVAVLHELTARLGTRGQRGPWAESWLGASEAAEAALDGALETEELSEPAVQRALAAAYADGDLVYTASSMPIRDQEAYAMGTGADVRFLANRGANGIDGLVSSGIGAAIASGRPTWILTGDLGLFHDLSSLALLAGSEAPVRLIVFDNGGGGIFEFLPQSGEVAREEFEALFGTATGLRPERAAAMWDLPHRRLERPSDIGGTPAAPELVEVSVDRRNGPALRSALMRAAADAAARSVSSARE
ncbi:MAG: 2-succinyl-5-enolpyruvyl-6-hydroxy-3-cyclohexene-1-carboxylic-acid synthase [Solirubrobacterales bacterium]